MVTGKDACREHFARQSIANFNQQDYANKRLIIINHASYVLLDNANKSNSNTSTNKSNSNINSNTIVEFHVDKDANSLTLGDLRNIARAMVPLDAVWTTWDDDDYHAPNYISTMMKELGRADVLVWTRRLEFNANTGMVWKMELTTGFAPLMFARQDMRMLYNRKDAMEDVHLLDVAKDLGKRIVVFQNEPKLYIRTVHENNTSLYVDKYKTFIAPEPKKKGQYIESNIDANDANIHRTFMSSYFKDGIECYNKQATNNYVPPE